MIDYAALKSAMNTAGYTVSSGSGWTTDDAQQYRQFLYFQNNGIDDVHGFYGLAYTGILTAIDPDFPVQTTRALQSIAITPTTSTKEIGATQAFVATGTYNVAPLTADITSSVTWASSSTATATIASTGVATAVAAGTSNVTASTGGKTSNTAVLTVNARSLVSIAVTGANTVVAGASTAALTATGTYSSAPTSAAVSGATWVSSNTAVATVSASGVVTGVAAGTTNITAASGGKTSPAFVVTVTAT